MGLCIQMLSWWVKERMGLEGQAAGLARESVYMAIRVSLQDPVRSVVTMRPILRDTTSNLRVRLTHTCQFYDCLLTRVFAYRYVFFRLGCRIMHVFFILAGIWYNGHMSIERESAAYGSTNARQRYGRGCRSMSGRRSWRWWEPMGEQRPRPYTALSRAQGKRVKRYPDWVRPWAAKRREQRKNWIW
jgi:hypothetical protein